MGVDADARILNLDDRIQSSLLGTGDGGIFACGGFDARGNGNFARVGKFAGIIDRITQNVGQFSRIGSYHQRLDEGCDL